ncbi:MAG TPA: Tex-like N-terminal domain-containing protein, partial [Aggregatilineales bacterium]|nr:Tex-like N-terminal domain-containing protein [Aggregatilineales bacterium]
MNRNYDIRIAEKLGLRSNQIAAAIRLLDEGNTIPFIARYRKELTERLDEEQLRDLYKLLDSMRKVDERRDTILKSIEEQGKLTPELQQQINQAENLTALEDLYQPYKPKRRTRASIAREKGLERLAEMILVQNPGNESPETIAKSFLNDEVPTVEDAL